MNRQNKTQKKTIEEIRDESNINEHMKMKITENNLSDLWNMLRPTYHLSSFKEVKSPLNSKKSGNYGITNGKRCDSFFKRPK